MQKQEIEQRRQQQQQQYQQQYNLFGTFFGLISIWLNNHKFWYNVYTKRALFERHADSWRNRFMFLKNELIFCWIVSASWFSFPASVFTHLYFVIIVCFLDLYHLYFIFTARRYTSAIYEIESFHLFVCLFVCSRSFKVIQNQTQDMKYCV